MKVLLVIFYCTCLVLTLLFAYANSVFVDFNYLFGHVQVHLMLLVFFVFAFASVLTALTYSARMMRQKLILRSMKKELLYAQAELKKLRCSPLKDKSL